MDINVRPAAVAGMFYPDSAAMLSDELARLFSAITPQPGLRPKAIIAPHAGYIYSGATAAHIYATIAARRETIRRVVLLGPTHRVAIDGLALPTSTAFETPLGTVPLDLPAMAAIRDMPQIVVSQAAHAQEHALEVQIPFLQCTLDEFSLVPLAVGRTSPEQVAAVIARLWGGDETLIVISSDLSHYMPYEQARQLDGQTARTILALDPTVDHRQACGATAINGLLLAARQRGLKAQLVTQCNSGDTAGDRSRVVGYGAFAFCADGED